MTVAKRVLHSLVQGTNSFLESTARVKIVRCAVHSPYEKTASKGDVAWDYSRSEGYWVGGRVPFPNTSHGYHGILKQWWEHYNPGRDCLLISESNESKQRFQDLYPDWQFTTLDLYDVQGGDVDIVADLCGDLSGAVRGRFFDLVICQATLEHVYNPFRAIENMFSLLRPGGVIAVHTHTPPYPYHAYPRDYFRFSLDWFEDLECRVKGIELLELGATGGHVFAALRKNHADSLSA